MMDTNDERTRTAHHEAGHAVLYTVLKLGCEKTSIEPDEDDELGHTWHAAEGGELFGFANDAHYLRHAIACYAGYEASRRWTPGLKGLRRSANGDYQIAAGHLKKVASDDDESLRLLTQYAKRRSSVLVDHYWPEITAVAEQLIELGTLTGDQVESLFDASLRSRQGESLPW